MPKRVLADLALDVHVEGPFSQIQSAPAVEASAVAAELHVGFALLQFGDEILQNALQLLAETLSLVCGEVIERRGP